MDQRENIIGGHQAGRDVTINNQVAPSETFMVRLRQKFDKERANDVEFRSTIDALQYYQDPIDTAPIGLQKKLELGNRQPEIAEALRAKELFAKCMARYSLSESAQEVIAYCLGQLQQLFRAHVTPLISQGAPGHQVDSAVVDQVIQPVLKDLEGNFLGIMPQELRGMVYYLTGNCFLVWHANGSDADVPPGA
jgi:hypothetical protein